MSCGEGFSAGPVQVDAVGAGDTLVWISSPRPAAGLTVVDGTLRASNVAGLARVRLAVGFYETHAEGAPTVLQPVGAATTGEAFVSADVSANAANHAFYRLALVGSLSSGAAPGTLTASVSGRLTQCGGVLGALGMDLVPGPSGQAVIVPVGTPSSPRDRKKWQAVVRILGKSGGNLTVQLVARTFAVSSRLPSAWTALGTAVDVTAMNAELLLSEDSGVDASAVALAQPGLRITPSTNAVNAGVQVLVQGSK